MRQMPFTSMWLSKCIADYTGKGDALLLFAADHRLLRAAQTEGLPIFNPEIGARAQLEALLS